MRRYWTKLSGPLLDRFDLVVEVPPVDLADFVDAKPGEPAAPVRERVMAARQIQHARYESEHANGGKCNAQLGSKGLDRFAGLSASCRRLLESA